MALLFHPMVLLGAIAVAARDMPDPAGIVIAGTLGIPSPIFHQLLQMRYVRDRLERDWEIGVGLDSYLRLRLAEDVIEQVPRLHPATKLSYDYSYFWSHGWQVAITATIALVGFLAVAL